MMKKFQIKRNWNIRTLLVTHGALSLNFKMRCFFCIPILNTTVFTAFVFLYIYGIKNLLICLPMDKKKISTTTSIWKIKEDLYSVVGHEHTFYRSVFSPMLRIWDKNFGVKQNIVLRSLRNHSSLWLCPLSPPHTKCLHDPRL